MRLDARTGPVSISYGGFPASCSIRSDFMDLVANIRQPFVRCVRPGVWRDAVRGGDRGRVTGRCQVPFQAAWQMEGFRRSVCMGCIDACGSSVTQKGFFNDFPGLFLREAPDVRSIFVKEVRTMVVSQ